MRGARAKTVPTRFVSTQTTSPRRGGAATGRVTKLHLRMSVPRSVHAYLQCLRRAHAVALPQRQRRKTRHAHRSRGEARPRTPSASAAAAPLALSASSSLESPSGTSASFARAGLTARSTHPPGHQLESAATSMSAGTITVRTTKVSIPLATTSKKPNWLRTADCAKSSAPEKKSCPPVRVRSTHNAASRKSAGNCTCVSSSVV